MHTHIVSYIFIDFMLYTHHRDLFVIMHGRLFSCFCLSWLMGIFENLLCNFWKKIFFWCTHHYLATPVHHGQQVANEAPRQFRFFYKYTLIFSVWSTRKIHVYSNIFETHFFQMLNFFFWFWITNFLIVYLVLVVCVSVEQILFYRVGLNCYFNTRYLDSRFFILVFPTLMNHLYGLLVIDQTTG